MCSAREKRPQTARVFSEAALGGWPFALSRSRLKTRMVASHRAHLLGYSTVRTRTDE